MTDFSPFLCQPLGNGQQQQQVYTPNIPDFYFDPETAVAFGSSPVQNLTVTTIINTFIYTLPPESAQQRNCTGPVTAIEYCYLATELDIVFGSLIEIFDLHILTRVGESQFQIEQSISIQSIPTSGKCHLAPPFNVACCETTTLSGGDVFSLPPSEFVFGVTVALTQLLIFADSAVEYNVQHLEVQSALLSGSFAVSVLDSLTSESLILMRFHAGIII